MPPALPTTDELLALQLHHPIWGLLDGPAQADLARRWEVQATQEGALLLAQGALPTRLGMVLAGAVDLHDPDLGRTVRLHRGAMFGFGSTPERHLATWQAAAAGDGAVAWLAPDALGALCAAHEPLEYHFPSLPQSAALQAQQAGQSATGDDRLRLNRLGTPLRALVHRTPVSLPPDTPIRAVAEHMRRERVSSVLLVEHGHLMGLVTDRDLRSRVLAEGLDPARPVRDIATLRPWTLQAQQPAFEALLLMARANIHHVPVLDGEHMLGMVTANDLADHSSTSAVTLAGEIAKQTTLAGLVQATARTKTLQRHLSEAGVQGEGTGHIITAITDAVTVRLIELAEAQLGPAPVEYVWVAAGSQGRNEQTARTDQDNCLVLSDAYDPALHGAWFRAFSRQVCDGLDACGYVHCPGGIMAMTDAWRQPVGHWLQVFRQWVDTPDQRALVLACVFFDLRAIHGHTALLDGLRRDVLRRTQANSLFLAHMVGNALKHRPPLGLFGTITPIQGGEHAGTVDLKHTGIVPIVDLARLFALASGDTAVNTQDRLTAAAANRELSPESARDLGEALAFLWTLRIRHQAANIARQRPPDNFLPLAELSNFERRQLKDAFTVVQKVQEVLAQRYQVGRY